MSEKSLKKVKFALFGNIEKIKDCIQDWVEIDNYNPTLVIVCGGDGTILQSERKYPGIPKITIRDSQHGNKCMYETYDISYVVDNISSGLYEIIEETKLVAERDGVVFRALNEIQIHNISPLQAIRFTIERGSKNGEEVLFSSRGTDEVIGDGCIVTTHFGATGYFSSIVKNRQWFPVLENQIGVGLNNPHNPQEYPTHAILPNTESIIVKMTRGDAWLISDNNPFMKKLETGDKVVIRKDKETAKFVKVKKAWEK